MSTAQRAGGVAALSLGLMLAAAGTTWLCSEFLGWAAARHIRNDVPLNALEPAGLSAELAPWRTIPRLQLLRSSAIVLDAVRLHGLSAIRLAPADGYLWAEYAQFLLRAGAPDQDVYQATRRSNHLAPSSRSVQRSNAQAAQQYWFFAGDLLQDEWMRSMQFMLRHEPAKFRRMMIQSRRAELLCPLIGDALGEAMWCAQLAEASRQCARPRRLKAEEKNWCRMMGFVK